MKVHPVRIILTLLALTSALILTTACPRNRDGTPAVTGTQIKSGARVVQTAAEEFGKELSAEVRDGTLSAEANDAVQPVLGEVVALSGRLADDRRDFDQLTTAARRQLLTDYIAELNDSAVRLNEAGALHLKSEKARKRFDEVTDNIRRGLSLARVVLAALPPPEQSPR